MLLSNLILNYFFKDKNKLYFAVISFKFGWLWITISNIFLYFIFLQQFGTFFKITKTIFEYFNSFLGFFIFYTKKLKLTGTGYKIAYYNWFFFLRNNLAHKTLVIPYKNIKYYLVKKTMFKLQSRKLHWIENITCNLRNFCNKNDYKKKGIFYKNEILFLKMGKVVKN